MNPNVLFPPRKNAYRMLDKSLAGYKLACLIFTIEAYLEPKLAIRSFRNVRKPATNGLEVLETSPSIVSALSLGLVFVSNLQYTAVLSILLCLRYLIHCTNIQKILGEEVGGEGQSGKPKR